MKLPPDLDRMVTDGRLVRRPRDRQWCRFMLEQARRDLTWARRKVEAGETIGAASDGWAATSNALQAALNVVDLAITSSPGHLDALLDAYEVLAGEGMEKDVYSLRNLKGARNEAVYRGRTPREADVAAWLADAERAVEYGERIVGRVT